jgi:glucosylceramidase
MTIQNEPLTGGDPWFPWNTCWFSSEDERDFAKLDLGPIMEEAGYPPSEFHIMTLDHNRPIVPDWSNIVFSDNEASKYIAGKFEYYREGF